MKARRLSSFVRHGLDNTHTAHRSQHRYVRMGMVVLRDGQRRARGSSARRKASLPVPRRCTHPSRALEQQVNDDTGRPTHQPRLASRSPTEPGAGCPRRHARRSPGRRPAKLRRDSEAENLASIATLTCTPRRVRTDGQKVLRICHSCVLPGVDGYSRNRCTSTADAWLVVVVVTSPTSMPPSVGKVQ